MRIEYTEEQQDLRKRLRAYFDKLMTQEVRDEIHSKLYRTHFRELYLKWIKELKDDAFIDIKQ